MNMAKKPPGLELEIFAFFPRFEAVHGLAIEISVYFFGGQGEIIDGAPIRNGKAELALSEEEVREGHILMSPSFNTALGETLTLTDMRARPVFESRFVCEPGKRAYTLPPVPELLWRRWLTNSGPVRLGKSRTDWAGILIW